LADGASPQTLLGELTALHQTPWLGLKGLSLRPLLLRKRDKRERKGRREEGVPK